MKTLHVAIIGMGSVGQGVLKVLADSRGEYPGNKAAIKVVAVADSKGVCVDENCHGPREGTEGKA